MKNAYMVLIAITFSSLLISCQENNPKSRFTLLQERIDSLNVRIDDLELRLRTNDILSDIDRIAVLSPGSDGYIVVKSDLGYITVSLDNIASYANGSKVFLKFGNTTSATINGLGATIEWGKIDSTGKPDYDNSLTRDVTFGTSLKPGTWTKSDVVLEGVPPSSLAYVRVKNLTHTGIRLFAN